MHCKIRKVHDKCYKINLEKYNLVPCNFWFLYTVLKRTMPKSVNFTAKFTKNNIWSTYDFSKFKKNNPGTLVWYNRSDKIYQISSSLKCKRCPSDKSKYDYDIGKSPTRQLIFQELRFANIQEAEIFLDELEKHYMFEVLSTSETEYAA